VQAAFDVPTLMPSTWPPPARKAGEKDQVEDFALRRVERTDCLAQHLLLRAALDPLQRRRIGARKFERVIERTICGLYLRRMLKARFRAMTSSQVRTLLSPGSGRRCSRPPASRLAGLLRRAGDLFTRTVR